MRSGGTFIFRRDNSRSIVCREYRLILTTLVCAVGLLLPPASAQDSGREDESLLEAIEELSLRVDSLEKEKAAAEKKAGSSLLVSWKNGLRFESEDGTFSVAINGKIQTDWGFQSGTRDLDAHVESHGDDLNDGVEFRRTRLVLSGHLHERFLYKTDYEFSGGDVDFKDVYIGLKALSMNITLKVGHFKEPVSLESNTGEASLRLMERSLMQALSPSRNTGLGLFGTILDERMTWGTGVFFNTDSYGDGGGDGDLSASARVTGLPWYGGDDRLLHLGLSYSRRGEDDIQFTAGPESHRSPDYIDTDGFVGGLSPHAVSMDAADLFGSETAFALGPFSAQAEYLLMNVDGPGGADSILWGGYVEGGFFLTGEHRAYHRKKGAFHEVTPSSDFLSDEGGPGAWEVTARVSCIDLDDADIRHGGEMINYSAGINWFLNPSVRLSTNYIHSRLEHVGSARLFLLRLALMF
jgi:phosphate-selective porin OprO and OprP